MLKIAISYLTTPCLKDSWLDADIFEDNGLKLYRTEKFTTIFNMIDNGKQVLSPFHKEQLKS